MLNEDKNHNKLYRAMNKYGIENFSIEVVEDNIQEQDLSNKEKEYINIYNSYYNGYNCTFGGDGESQVDVNELISLFLSGKNYSEISLITGHTRKTISQKLKVLGYESPYLHVSGNLNKGKAIKYNNKEFASLTLLAKYLQENVDIFKDKKVSTIIKGISKNIKQNKPYCGEFFEFL